LDFDNSEFVSRMQQRGFFVAPKATSNYPVTLVSLSSTLNFSYLDGLFGSELGEFQDRRFLRELMQRSRAVRLLHSAGYQVATFRGEYSEAQIGGVDVSLGEWWFLNQFQLGLAAMTPVPAILAALGKPVAHDIHRLRTTYPFDHIQDAIELPGPKFVYSHLYFAHPPFVFGADGEYASHSWDYTWDDGDKLLDAHGRDRQDYIEGYRNQVSYLNGRLEQAIDEILASSDRTPIIIVHGDHGPGSRYSTNNLENTDLVERYSIFYAALLPGGGNADLYDTVSPVNGFRIVFNRYLGTDFPLLEDRSYYNRFLYPYAYTRVDPASVHPTGD
jgi:hypothetical protein